jgi:hypothetical protein
MTLPARQPAPRMGAFEPRRYSLREIAYAQRLYEAGDTHVSIAYNVRRFCGKPCAFSTIAYWARRFGWDNSKRPPGHRLRSLRAWATKRMRSQAQATEGLVRRRCECGGILQAGTPHTCIWTVRGRTA